MNASENSPIVTLVGTLPPLKGISPYCAEYALRLAKDTKVEFIGFKKLYPERLYPGGTSCEDLYPIDLDHPNLSIRNILTWYNPISWLWAGLSMKGDIVHVQWWSYPLAPVFFVLLAVSRLRRKRVFMTVHNVHPHEGGRFGDFLNSLVFPLADKLIVHSEKNKKELRDFGFDERKIIVLPHHIIRRDRIRKEHASPPKEEARIKSGIPLNAKVLCFFGNIRAYKGLDNLLYALDKVRESFPDTLLIIAGQPWEPWDKYELIIKGKGLEPNLLTKLYYLPFHELEILLRASDLVVFPFKELHSASDSVSLALALGCKVLCTEHLEMPYAEDLLFAADSHQEAIADSIIRFFQDNLEEGSNIKQRAPKELESEMEFSLTSVYQA
ncbi:MAG: glycosyltransferase [Actinobacteria bacterium]|nr:glycosyltransferase [Actinomycetota bacterium]